MIDLGQFSPAETTIKLGEAVFTCRLPLPRIAELQQARGIEVTWPDGARGHRVKPLGLIWVEHCQSGEYDPLDSWEIIRQALLGGEGGVKGDGEPIAVNRAVVDKVMADQVVHWPLEHRWRAAMAILIACCQGYQPPDDEADSGNVAAASQDTSPSTMPPPSETAPSGKSDPATPTA